MSEAVRAVAQVGLVVHPSRPIDEAVSVVRDWAQDNGSEVFQVSIHGQHREVAPFAEPGGCDLVVAIGGDGTALAALRVAADAGRPVLAVGCGSLGALTSVSAENLHDALCRFAAGDWQRLDLPAVEVRLDQGRSLYALNDVAVVRRGEGQVRVTSRLDGTLYGRFAGDGCIVSTPVGSSGYSLAARGPLIAPGADAFLLTPLTAHGGTAPPLVMGTDSTLELEVTAGHGGGRLELDGQDSGEWSERLTVTVRRDAVTAVRFDGDDSFIEGLRRRRIIIDSPRLAAEQGQG